jgi:hypothetical protein
MELLIEIRDLLVRQTPSTSTTQMSPQDVCANVEEANNLNKRLREDASFRASQVCNGTIAFKMTSCYLNLFKDT